MLLATNSLAYERWPEQPVRSVHGIQDWRIQARRNAARYLPLPRAGEEFIKSSLRRIGLMEADQTPAFFKSNGES